MDFESWRGVNGKRGGCYSYRLTCVCLCIRSDAVTFLYAFVELNWVYVYGVNGNGLKD